MKNIKYTKETLKEDILKINPNFNLEIIDNPKNSRVLVKTKYGICNPFFISLKRNQTPSIQTAINKTEYFINKLKEIHVDKLQYDYDYSLVEYVNDRAKVKIICKKHGIFEMKATSLLKGSKCHTCAKQNYKKAKKVALNFITRSKDVHGDTYEYDKCIYINSYNKVTITCRIHGDFEQIPFNHLKGNGCKKCASIANNNFLKNKDLNLRSYSGWKKAGLKSKNFDSFKVYILECWNENERFFKVGKTFLPIIKRFSGKDFLPYNYKILKIIQNEDADYISKLENKIQIEHISYRYIPKISFKGHHECFTKINNLNYE
jgi:hypothetical protein